MSLYYIGQKRSASRSYEDRLVRTLERYGMTIWHTPSPEGVGVASGAKTPGVLVELHTADVILNDVVCGALLNLHAFVTVRFDGIPAHVVEVTHVNDVILPL